MHKASVATLAAVALVVGTAVSVSLPAPAGAMIRPGLGVRPDLGPVVTAKGRHIVPAKPGAAPTMPVPAKHGLAPGTFTLVLTAMTSGVRPGLDAAQPDAVAVGSSGVKIARPANDHDAQPATIKLDILSAEQAQADTGSSLAFRLASTNLSGSLHALRLRVPGSALEAMYGADWVSRVRWVELPASATRASISSGAVRPVAVPHAVQADGSTWLTPSVSATPMVLAATSDTTSSSGGGTWAATSLAPASTWQVSIQGGSFDWNYPLSAPPPAAGPTPSLALSYDSGSVDGETAATNNQSSVVGDGWQLAGTGFIERSYLPCAKDGFGLPAEQAASGDLCWFGDRDTISFGGHSGALVPTATAGEFRIQGDDGSRVQYLPTSGTCTDGGADNGCWKLTTQDGTSYFFGRSSNSAWTVPVYGDDSGDECYHLSGTDFAHSACTQPWRWNLDRVVDLHGNAENFTYVTESNHYHQNNGGLVSYVRGGYLTRIGYGIASGTTTVSDDVEFGYASTGRCNATASGADCSLDAQGKATSPQSYPDVPWDQYCAAGQACTGLNTPSFFTNTMLETVTTKALVSGALTAVDTWTMHHSFLDPGDTSAASMWLASISHPGLSDTAFTPIALPNRVLNDQFLPLEKQRIQDITLNTGAVLTVDYAPAECTSTTIANLNPASNTHQCFPQWWTPPGSSPRMDWFAKYRVKQVTELPETGNVNDMPLVTQFEYTSAPAWRLNTSPFTLGANRTWSIFAGYSTVEVRVGDPDVPAVEHTTDYRYFQGLDGDPDGTATDHYRSVTLSGDGLSSPDSLWFAGRAFETITRLGANGAANTPSTTPILTDTYEQPWAQATAARTMPLTFPNPDPAATGSYSATVDLRAYQDGTGTTKTEQTKSDTTSRAVTTTVNHDSYGRATSVETLTPDAGNTCARTEYATNASAWLLDLPSRQYTVGVGCTATPAYPQDAVSESRYFYDGASTYTGQSPAYGNLTRTDLVRDYTASTPVLVTTAVTPNDATGYDAMGRLLKVTDENGVVTSTSYGPATTGPLTSTVEKTTPPASQATLPTMSTTTNYDPRWGKATSVSNPNGYLTTTSYDTLGRLTGVWLPDRPLTTDGTGHTGTASLAYAYHASAAPLETTTTTLTPTGGTVATYDFFDGLGRHIQSQSSIDAIDPSTYAHYSGGTVLTDTFYDPAGQVWLTNNPYGNTDIQPTENYYNPPAQTQFPSQTQTIWDGAGRRKVESLLGPKPGAPFGEYWHTSYTYAGTDRSDVTPPAGGTPSTTYTDSRGRTTELDQYLSTTPTGPTQQTTYSYDARGDLTSMIDPTRQHTWSWTYDARGLLKQSSDPDTGSRTNSYDPAGNLTESDDAATGAKTQLGYDAYNRKISQREYQTAPSTGWAQVAQWNYDAATAGLGLPSSSVSYTGSTATAAGTAYTKQITKYDPNGKPLSWNYQIPNWAGIASYKYTTVATYDQSGNLASQSYSAAGGIPSEKVSDNYDSFGNLNSVGSLLSQYLGRVEFTNINQPGKFVFNNGSGEIDRINTYDAVTQRLLGVLTNTSASTNFHLANHTYSYTNAGQLTSDSNTADGKGTDTQCYQYDNLQELTSAWTPANNACATPGGSLGGPAPYYQSFGYDTTTGNRLYTDKHSVTGTGTDTRISESYAATGTPTPPHLVSQTSTATAPAGTSPTGSAGWGTGTNASYGYDKDGQTTSRPGSQVLAWNPENRLAKTTIGTRTISNVYDADGNLLLQTDSTSGSTLYLGDTELHTAAGSTTATATRTYSAYGMPIAERSTTPAAPTTSKLYWLNASPLGQNTVTDEVDASNVTSVTHRYLDPFGGTRGTGATWTSTHTFLNAPANTTLGTVHLGARDYDPALGRFLSSDPVFDESDPLHDNAYAYADNDPVNASDPTGLQAACDGPCHGGDNARPPGGTQGVAAPKPSGDPYADEGDDAKPAYGPPKDHSKNPFDFTTWHDQVARDAGAIIVQQAQKLGWTPNDIQYGVRIEGASKKCKIPDTCTRPGYADIVLTVESGNGIQQRFVWEVKKWTIGEIVAKKEATDYVDKINKNVWAGGGKSGERANAAIGWTINGPYNGNESGENTSFWGSVDGAVVYANKRDDRAAAERRSLQEGSQLQVSSLTGGYWDAYRPSVAASTPAAGSGGGAGAGHGSGLGWPAVPFVPFSVPDLPVAVP